MDVRAFYLFTPLLTSIFLLLSACGGPSSDPQSGGAGNTPAVIGGADAGTVEEDIAVVTNNLSVSGALTISDVDAGEASFTAATIVGNYGALVIQIDGSWSYTADNTQMTIQQLNLGQSLTDSLTVFSVDNTTHDVVITINGSDEVGGIGGGSTADCSLTISPGDDFISAFAQISAGDTLCLNDGLYQQAMDIPSNTHVRAVNDGMAELDGMDTLGIEWQGGILTLKGDNSSVRGLKVYHARTNANACTVGGNNNTMITTSCSHGGSHKHKIPLSINGSGHLIEDSWFYGEGRYVVLCYGGSNITLRRNVIRWDETIAGEPNEPNAGVSNYSCTNMIWENNISLDYGVPVTAMIHCGDFCMSTETDGHPALGDQKNENVQYLGNMSINHDPATSNNVAFRADQKGSIPSNNITIRDFYVRSVGAGITVNPIYQNVSVEDCTMIDVPNTGQLNGQPITCNGDADIEFRYIDGIKSSESLWPWPNEALIKRDMCDQAERQSDWCLTDKTLSDYVRDL